MVIMSDMESFAWKLSCILFFIFGTVMAVLYARATDVEPKVVYVEPEVVVDTVIKYDTITISQKLARSKVVNDTETISHQTNVSADTEKIE